LQTYFLSFISLITTKTELHNQSSTMKIQIAFAVATSALLSSFLIQFTRADAAVLKRSAMREDESTALYESDHRELHAVRAGKIIQVNFDEVNAFESEKVEYQNTEIYFENISAQSAQYMHEKYHKKGQKFGFKRAARTKPNYGAVTDSSNGDKMTISCPEGSFAFKEVRLMPTMDYFGNKSPSGNKVITVVMKGYDKDDNVVARKRIFLNFDEMIRAKRVKFRKKKGFKDLRKVTFESWGNKSHLVQFGMDNLIFEITEPCIVPEPVSPTSESPISGADTGGVAPSCPCFDADDLDKASVDIASGSYTFYPDPTCEGSASKSNSISYSDTSSGHPSALGYEVRTGECRESDVFRMISTSEEAACRSLLDEKCAEHKIVFDAAAIAAVPSCPCFDANDLDKAAADVASGSYTFKPATTCTGSDSGSNGIVYTDSSRGYDRLMGYEVRSDSCRKSDIFFFTSASENSVCKSLLTSKCAEHSSTFDAATAAATPLE
jgi:hypothetical protein